MSVDEATPNFQKFFDNSVDMMLVADSRGGVISTNEACTTALGWTQDEWLEQDFAKLSHPDDVATLVAESVKLREGNLDASVESRFRHQDGTYRWVSWVAWSNSGVTNIIARDVTSRRLIDDALRDSEAKIRLILNSVSSAILTIDLNGRLEEFNPAAEKLFGYSAPEVLGHDVSMLVPERFRSDHEARLKRFAKTGKSDIIGVNRELTGLRKDGAEILLELEVSAVEVQSRHLLTGIARDVTNLQAARTELEAARLVAEQANDAKSNFLSRMSHELRTPLNAILGFAQLMKTNAASIDQDEAATMILKAGRHLLSLVNEVLDISRVESGQLSLSPEAIEVSDVLRDCLALLDIQAKLRNIEFVDRSTDNLVVRADRQRLKQVLLNLLANSIKYSFEGGTVAVLVTLVSEGRVRIEVSDEGPGIHPEAIDRLFTPFERLGAQQSEIEGTGLGLALSAGLVEAMGGKIGVDSNFGHGSKFWFELPHVDTPVDKVAEFNQRIQFGEEVRDLKGTLLYIEDNESNQRLLDRALTLRPGVTLLAALDGTTGLELARLHSPDVIFLDLHLPDISGREVLKLLRTDHQTRDIPVVIVSADASPGQIKRLRIDGAYAYITKPIEFDQMFNLLDEVFVPSATD
jgi:PAS domain S-box-containing protein